MKKFPYYLSVSLLIISLFACNEPEEKMSSIKVQGNKFITETGEDFTFRGLCFSDPDKLEKAGKWGLDYFTQAKDWGANVVRFAVHPQRWRERGEENYIALIDSGINWAEQTGLYVIIDWHSIGNLHTEMFQHEMYNTTKEETKYFWDLISKRYKDNPVIPIYEIFNEPVAGGEQFGEMEWADWKVLVEEIIDVIYANDTNVIPIVAGFNWAYELSQVKDMPIEREGIAYVSHPYPQKREQPWEEKWEEDFGYVADKYPVIATELGFMADSLPGAHIPVISDVTYGNHIIDFFEKKGISWTVWCFDPNWTPTLISDWDYTPTTQGEFFRKKLLELNKK